jgi:hypothetical protein
MSVRLTFKRGAIAATAALVLAGGAVGVVGAQQAPTATPGPGVAQVQQRQDQFLSTLAGKLGVTVDRLRQALTDTKTELGMPGRGPGPFGGRGGPGGPGRPGFGRVGGFHLDAVAQVLGITPEQLRQELPGKSLTDVARAHNVDPARVATALKNEANTRIDQAVTNGRLTAEQATQAKQRASEQIDRLMTVQLPTPPAPGTARPGERGPRIQGGGPGTPGTQRTPAGTATPSGS